MIISPRKAKVGDLIVVHRNHCEWVDGKYQWWDTFTVGRVTKTTLMGRAKEWRSVTAEFMPFPRQADGVWIIPAERVDVLAVLCAASQHTDPGSDQPTPYKSDADMRAAIRPHLTDPLACISKRAWEATRR